MAITSEDFSFQGPIYLGDNVNGKLVKPVWVGDATSLTFAIEVGEESRTETWSGTRGRSVTLFTTKVINPELVLRAISPKNLALGLHGTASTVAAGTVTGESIPTVAVGDLIKLDHGMVSSLVVTDSTTPTPLSVVLGTNYKMKSAPSGLLEVANLGALVQPWKAAYSYGASTRLGMLTQAPPVKYLFMEAINTVDNRRALVHLFKIQFKPLASLPLINEGLADFSLSGSSLIDANNILNSSMGGFGMIEWLDDGVV